MIKFDYFELNHFSYFNILVLTLKVIFCIEILSVKTCKSFVFVLIVFFLIDFENTLVFCSRYCW